MSLVGRELSLATIRFATFKTISSIVIGRDDRVAGSCD